MIAEVDPASVVFDGTHPYEALLGALPADATAVWCRRPLWKRGSSRVPLGRAGAFDAVLEPGELAESEDAGPTVALRDRAHRVGPIVLLDRSELLDRERGRGRARARPGAADVLVTLGQGPEVREATRRGARPPRRAARRGPGGGALVGARRRPTTVPEGVVALRATYPMSRYFAAFDGAVAAAGYNAYHELIELGVPSLFVPMPRDTDDQPARARWAEGAGLGLGVAGPDGPGARGAARPSARPGRSRGARRRARRAAAGDRRRRRRRLARASWRWRRPRRPHPAPTPPVRRGWRDFRRRWGTFLASAPRTAWRLGRQQLTEPRARTAGAGARDRSGRGHAARSTRGDRRGGRGAASARCRGHRRARGARRAARARGRGRARARRAARGRPSSPAATTSDFRSRRLELIRAERPEPRRIVVAPGGASVP